MRAAAACAIAATVLLGFSPADAAIAYIVPAGTVGTQDFSGTYGMDFDVTGPDGILVTSLGAFDSNSDGIVGTITVGIFDRSTMTLVGSALSFTGTDGALIGGSRFLQFAVPLELPNGFQGVIAAQGYNASELGANAGLPGATIGTTDDGGGLIAFVGTSRFGDPGAFAWPHTPDAGGVNRYGAGTFEFQAIPEPSVLALLICAAGLLGVRRRQPR